MTVLVTVAIGGLVWSGLSFFTTNKLAVTIKNTPENFAAFKAAELPDKCLTPPGYSDEEWREHMSHHPDQYGGCFTTN